MKTTNAMKRLLSLVLALVLTLSMIPRLAVPASAFSLEISDDDDVTDGAFTYLGTVRISINFGGANHYSGLSATVTYPYTGKTWTVTGYSNSTATVDLSDAFTAETFPGVDSPAAQRTFRVKAEYEGETLEKDFVFNVRPRNAFADQRNFTFSPEASTYSGDIPDVTLVNIGTQYGDKTLVAGKDYTVENPSGNNMIGWKEFLFTGIGNYSGSLEYPIRIVPTTEIPDIRMEADAVHYDGTAKEPGVIVTFNGKTVDTVDYELSYSDNVEVGTATVTITGRRNFSYETTRTFQIQDHVWVNECCGTDLQCKDCDATKENDRTEHEFSDSACLHCSFVCVNHSYNADLECTICGAKMENYVGINDITLDIGTTIPANREVFVTATAYPEDRTGQDVIFTYEIEEDNGAQAYVSDAYLTAYDGGTFKLKVTANDGFTTYSKTFTITSVYTPVTAVDGTVPTEAEVGQITLPSGFLPQEVSSEYDLAWEVQSGPATVQGNVLTLTDVGTVKLRAYVINGLGVGQPFVQEYTIEAKPAQTVLPVELKINEGNIIISEHSATELKVEYGGSNESVISKDTPVQISGSSNSNYTITVKSGAPKIILRDVNIRNYSAHPLLIESGASADITLLGSNTLDASVRAVGVAGLGVPEGASVTIGGTGTLTVKGGGDAAGIGSRAERNSGTITINGGTVNATGGNYGAGIGSGEKGTAGTITINGGNVNAQGGDSAAGIGGGNGGVASVVTINSGTVNASGGRYGPGIGSGNDGRYTYNNPAQITITGGTVTAKGGSEGAGIGGGSYRPGATVIVTGGNVKAIAGWEAAAIGRGRNGRSDGTLTNGTAAVTCRTITLAEMTTQTAVTSVTGIGSYGLRGVRTLDSNKLYFYLPADTTVSAITAGDGAYYFCKDSSLNYYTSHDWSNKDGVCAHCGETCDHEGEENTCSICGKPLHDHDWEYFADGSTITAKCRNADTCSDPEQSITISAAGKTYDGTAVIATLTGSIDGVTDPTISYSGNTNVGTYTASIQLDGKKATVLFEIKAATPTVVWDNTTASMDYTGSAAVITAPVVTLVNNETYSGTIHFSYTGTSSGSGLPTHAGTYTVTASVAANGNYTAATSTNTLKLTINKIDPIYTIPTGLTATYGDTLADVELSDGFAWEDSITTSVGNVGSNNFNVTYTPSDTANYNTMTGISVSVEVGKAASSVIEVPTANELTYNGSEQTLIAAGSTNDGELVYSLTKDGAYSEALPKAKTAGEYLVWYKVIGDSNHKDSTPASIEVEIAKADPSIGAVTAGVVNDTLETSAIVLTRANTDIPGTLTVDAGQTLAWGDNTIRYTFTPNDTTNYKVVTGTVNVTVDDTIAPTGTVSIDDNQWNDLWNTITFGLFFKETKTVKVMATDALSGIAKVEYYDSATALSADAVKAITAWTDMGEDYAQDVTAEDAKTFIYYIRITDNAGNVTYISTADATYDLTKPAISGITNGSTYYTTQKVTVTDTNLDSVTLNGETVTDEITLEGNKEATYTIVATDKAGNETTCTVTMKPIASISAPIDAITESNVNSGNTDAIAEVEAAAAALDTTNATDAEKAAIKAITDKCDALQEVIADTAAEYERITDAIAAYDPDEVTSADKAALDKLAEDLEALAESGNLTDSEKTALETPTENLDAMIETVTEVAAEADRIADAVGDYALETVKSSDKDEIEQLIKDIDALLATDNLTDAERTALEGEKTKCENLLAKIEGTDALVDKLIEDVGAYDEDTVKSTDKAALERLLEDIEAVIEGNTNITEEEKAELEELADTVEDLLAKIEEVAQAPVTEDTEKVKDITNENVTPENKEDLEKAKADLEDALTENAGDYTEDEKKAIQEEIDRIDDALEAIENVEAAEETVSKLPAVDKVKPDDEDAIKAITDAKAEYDALTGHEKSLVDEDTKKKLDDLCAALVAYDIIKGEDGKYTQGGSKGLSFIANGAYSKFTGILVDNKVVDSKHYTAESGSTVITLKASYLDTLSTGKHTLTVVYTDGETSCEFNIAAKSTTPATGDNSHMMLWFSLMIVSCAAILVLLNYKRFFSYGGKHSK